jgi:hypothetical protein
VKKYGRTGIYNLVGQNKKYPLSLRKIFLSGEKSKNSYFFIDKNQKGKKYATEDIRQFSFMERKSQTDALSSQWSSTSRENIYFERIWKIALQKYCAYQFGNKFVDKFLFRK